MNKWWILPIAFVLLSRTSSGQDDCQLKKGLFERRLALIAAGGVQGSGASDTTAASEELRHINEQYFQFLMRVSSGDHQNDTELDCCKTPEEDPVARIVCRYARYLRTGKKDHRLLLDSVPTDATGREGLWALEPIAYLHAEREPENVPALFKPSGPVTLYLDDLFGLVRSGDGEATAKYLELYLYSDSEHAEEMDEQIEKLLRVHLGVVVRQWDVFKRHRQALVKFVAFLSGDEKRNLKSEIAKSKECVAPSEACSELRSLLSAKTTIRE